MGPSQYPKICAITGANGYLGSKIFNEFQTSGWKVWKLTSTPIGGSCIPFRLESQTKPEVLKENEIKVLIHCAYDFKARTPDEIRTSNIDGTLKLFEAARLAGVERIIFISSMAAFEGCSSLYGKAKLEVENQAKPELVISVRPGLILGKKPGGIVGSILKILSILPIAPMIGFGTQPMYTTYDEDLAKWVVATAQPENPRPRSPVYAAHPSPVKFREIIETLAQTTSDKKVRFIPIPGFLIMSGILFLELLGFKMRIRSDSLRSFLNPNPNPEFDPKVTVSFKSFSDASHSNEKTKI